MTVIHKTVTSDAGDLQFVLSDDTVDRYGDIIEASGWVLNHFKKNPIALFGHSSSFPIGTWSDVKIKGKQLIGTLKLAARGTSARIDELISLAEQGVLRAVSVGFRPIKSEPLDPEKPYAGQRYLKQELLECSLVSVPANPAAIVLAKQLGLSNDTLSLAFGESADIKTKEVNTNGKQAASNSTSIKGIKTVRTLAQRIVDAQNDLNTKRDKLLELNQTEGELELDAIEGLTDEISLLERSIAAMKAAETKIGTGGEGDDDEDEEETVIKKKSPASNLRKAPAILRKPLGSGLKGVSGLDLLVRQIVVKGIKEFGGVDKSVDQILQERYPNHEATAAVVKAAQTIGTTTVSGWASELVVQAWAGFLDALMPYSVYPALRARGIGLSFDGVGTVNIPGRTAGGAGGGFVAEGAPIRVGRITTANRTLSPRKMGVIVPFSRELAKRSTPTIEALVRQAILEDTGVVLDTALLDATAGSTVRPAGLLNGVTAAGTAFGGGDYAAVIADFRTLLTPFYTANAAGDITVLMNPTQGLSLAMMPGPGPAGTGVGQFGWFAAIGDRLNIIESTNVPVGTIIALRTSDFATALGDTPEFDVSEQATVHMEDTTPLEIVSATGPTTANPVRSFFQTATIGVRMLMDVAWTMRRAGMVQYISGVSW